MNRIAGELGLLQDFEDFRIERNNEYSRRDLL